METKRKVQFIIVGHGDGQSIAWVMAMDRKIALVMEMDRKIQFVHVSYSDKQENPVHCTESWQQKGQLTFS